MSKYITLFTTIFVVAFCAAAVTPIETLQSDASLEKKIEACRLISISGNADAIAVLEPLLEDAKLAHMARYALEPMKSEEADAALLRALQATTDKLKAGIIASLGVRKTVAAVPDLIPLLGAADGFVVEATARSLGRIADPEGIAALEKHLSKDDLSYAVKQALGDGIFTAAETLLEKDNGAEAARLYDAVYAAEALPMPVRAAALRGAVLARETQEGLPLLIDAIRGENAVFFTAALRTVMDMEQPGYAANHLVKALPDLPEDRKIRVVQLLGELGQNSLGRAVLKEAETGTIPVRIAALKAAIRMGYRSALPILTVLVSSDEKELAAVAKEGLSYFPGRAGDDAVKAMLTSANVQIRLIAIELISNGALPEPAKMLMQVARDDSDAAVRLAALNGVKKYAGVEQLSELLQFLLEPQSADEMTATEEAVKQVCMREKAFTKEDIEITHAVYGNLPDGPQKDVTKKVRQLLASGNLSVTASNRNFGDTAPGKVKQLQVDYVSKEMIMSQTVQEGQTIQLATAIVPDDIVNILCESFERAKGPSKMALLRVLGATGSTKAFETVLPIALTGKGDLKEIAIKAVCDWPTDAALPTLLEWIKTPPSDTVKIDALRGAGRMLKPGQDSTKNLCKHYSQFLAQAGSVAEKKLILSGLGNIGSVCALEMVLEQVADEAVKAEAVQAAITISEKLGDSPEEQAVLEKAKALVPQVAGGDKK